MFVQVDTGSGEVSLEDPGDFTRFHVVSVGGAPTADVVATLGDHGAAVDGVDDHVWLRVDSLRAMARLTAGDGWDEGFDGMLAYAASKGWTDDDRTRIQAHIEF